MSGVRSLVNHESFPEEMYSGRVHGILKRRWVIEPVPGSAKPDHVFHGLHPEEEEALGRVLEVGLVDDADESAFEIVINLPAHFLFDLVEDFVGIGHEEFGGFDLELAEVLFVIGEDIFEAIAFAGEVVPVGTGSVFKGG